MRHDNINEGRPLRPVDLVQTVGSRYGNQFHVRQTWKGRLMGYWWYKYVENLSPSSMFGTYLQFSSPTGQSGHLSIELKDESLDDALAHSSTLE